MTPLLELGLEGERRIRDCVGILADKFGLSAEEREELLPSGTDRVLNNRIHWAATYLVKAGALERPQRGYIRTTERGKELLRQHPEGVSRAALLGIAEFLEFERGSGRGREGRATRPADDIPAGAASTAEGTPEERIEAAHAELTAELRTALLQRVIDGDPQFFERLVVDLLVAMGYGGSRVEAARQVGRSGDEGIDGVIDEDALGLDVIYVQAKRYDPANSIGREKIQQFAGALVGQGASKGVFVTTSSFTKGASDYASRIPQRIVLIGGDELTRLMVRYGVGVRTERSLDIKRVDTDYFETDVL